MPRPRGRPADKWEIHRRLGPNHQLQKHPSRSWTVVRKLGAENRGALNGGVYIVKDRRTDEKYIEKRAMKELVRDGTVLQEITILKYLSEPSHEHITRMVDHFVDRRLGKASIYLERCSLGGLEALIEDRLQHGELFNEIDVWEWFIQLFDALSYCHYGPNPEARLKNRRPEDWENSWDMVFHRDIKVENILVHQAQPRGMSTGYTLKLADFGCAIARRHIWVDRGNDRTQVSAQTRAWAPPESPDYAARSDVWQLAGVVGCICNVMIMPFFDHKAPARGYSTALNHAIAEAMKEDVGTRPKSDEVLKHVRSKYKTKLKDLERSPRPDPVHIDRERRKRQLDQGRRKMKARFQREEMEQMRRGGFFAGGPPFAGGPGRPPWLI